jgi:DNA-binding CsgD family transcriptional regulator
MPLQDQYDGLDAFAACVPKSQRPKFISKIKLAMEVEHEVRFYHQLSENKDKNYDVLHILFNNNISIKKGHLLGLIQIVELKADYSELFDIFSEDLNSKQKEINELEIAIKQLLKNIENEKQAVRNNIAMYFENVVVPVFKEIKKNNKSNEKINGLMTDFKNLFDGHNRKIYLLQNGLTAKEMEICYQLIQRQSGKEIATNLDISYLTLRTHTKNIRKKLSLKRHQNLSLFLEEHLSSS